MATRVLEKARFTIKYFGNHSNIGIFFELIGNVERPKRVPTKVTRSWAEPFPFVFESFVERARSDTVRSGRHRFGRSRYSTWTGESSGCSVSV